MPETPAPAPGGPVSWSEDGVPSSTLYDDIYHSEAGALAQARYVFLGGNGLPGRWQGRDAFTVLETGFGLGLNFLATLQAWQNDPARPRRLHFVSVEAHPVGADDIRRAVSGHAQLAELAPLGHALADRYPLALPGLHRIEFTHEGCTAVLTLAIGDADRLLRDLHLAADAVYLDGFSPAVNPDMWSPALMKRIARLMRPGGTAATWTIAASLRRGLAEAGFVVRKTPGLLPKRDALSATYAPAWPRPASWPDNSPRAPARRALVIGAGLAGGCTAHALASRGWQVTVLDAGPGAGSGASGLPAGLMVPHVSPDDAPMSQLTRAGAALMRRWIADTGLPAADARANGVLQRVDDAHKARAPAAWGALAGGLFTLQGDAQGPARHFPDGMAISPGALVRHLLARHADIRTRWQAAVASLAWRDGEWLALGADGQALAQAPVVVVASALASLQIASPDAPHILRAVRGQMTVGRTPLPRALAPAQPLSGDGHFIAPLSPDSPWAWLMGASFERGETSLQPTPEAAAAAHASNRGKLARLAPALLPHLAQDFEPPIAQAWVQVRCVSPDRLPVVGAVPGRAGLHVLAALGSRGLSLAAICAELLASQLEGEPWPVEAALGEALAPGRFLTAR